eukprot:4789839-Prymnesium_polylepis.2
MVRSSTVSPHNGRGSLRTSSQAVNSSRSNARSCARTREPCGAHEWRADKWRVTVGAIPYSKGVRHGKRRTSDCVEAGSRAARRGLSIAALTACARRLRVLR